MGGFLYVMDCGGRDILENLIECKIGVSKDPKSRFATLSASNPRAKMLAIIEAEDMYSAEKQVHEKFKKFKVKREIFNIPKEELTLLLMCKKFKGRIAKNRRRWWNEKDALKVWETKWNKDSEEFLARDLGRTAPAINFIMRQKKEGRVIGRDPKKAKNRIQKFFDKFSREYQDRKDSISIIYK